MKTGDLEELERLLARLGFFPGPIDGVIDDKSRAAIRGYQDFAALPADGAPSETLLTELRDVVQLMAELNVQQAEPEAPSVPDAGPSADEPPVAEVEPEVPTAEASPAEAPVAEAPQPTPPEPATEAPTVETPPATQETVAEAPQPTPPESAIEAPTVETPPATPETVAEAPPPTAETLPVLPELEVEVPLPEAETPPATPETVAEAPPPTAETLSVPPEPEIEAPLPKTDTPPAPRDIQVEVSHPVAKPPLARRKPARAPAPARRPEPAAPSVAELAEAPAPVEAGSSVAVPQEPPSPPAPAGTLLEQIIAAIENPPGRAPAPAPEAPSQTPQPEKPQPSATPASTSEPDRFQAALAPYAPLIAAGRMSEEELARTFNERGKVQFVKGLYDQAIADYDLAIHVKPDFAAAHHNRGVAHEALGHFAQAKRDFEAAKRLGYRRPGAL